jgi:hypothetical protein
MRHVRFMQPVYGAPRRWVVANHGAQQGGQQQDTDRVRDESHVCQAGPVQRGSRTMRSVKQGLSFVSV